MESETKENDLSLQTIQNEEDVNFQNENNIIKVEGDKVINEDKTVIIDKEMYEKLVLTDELYEFFNSDEFLNRLRSSMKDKPLHVASALGKLDIVTKLVIRGANVNVRNANDETPLHLAVQNNHLNVATFLVENNALIVAQDDYKLYTPLHWAVSDNHVEIVEYLCSLKDSCHLHIKDIQKRTPLKMARVGFDRPECAKIIENRLKL